MGRDKFASMAAAAAAPRRDKFAAVQQQKLVDHQKQQRQALLARCHQRDGVWNDMNRAEAAVTKLLGLAGKTADQLAEDTTTSLSHPKEDLEAVQESYKETVDEIYRLLSPHADLVKAYTAPTHINRMYVQRVEHRLAESRLELMQELLSQEEEDDDDETETAPKNADVAVFADTDTTTKRKREDE